MLTRPTKIVTGKTQNNVKALRSRLQLAWFVSAVG